ncbi:MAG: ArsR/SmtB family transcription factor [Candidatus Asgardarchaeia archaeon]
MFSRRLRYRRPVEEFLEEEIVRLLETLGNETRIRILQLLSREPMYVSEISRTLRVGQQAVLRHLQELEELGLIKSYKGESIRGQERKYFRINKNLALEIIIRPDSFRAKILKPVEEIEEMDIEDINFLLEKAKRILLEEEIDDDELNTLIRHLEKVVTRLAFLIKRVEITIERLKEKRR